MTPDRIEPEVPEEVANEPQIGSAAASEGSDLVKKMTHEVDTGDMFSVSP